MICSVTDMREKEIINLKDGCRLGAVSDLEFDTHTGKLVHLVVFGKGRLIPGRGKSKDIKIKWEEIQVVGDDTILVDFDCPAECLPQKSKNPLDSLFRQG